MGIMTKHLITTAIPYMNGAPHVGHALEMVLTDVIVRGRRLIGDDVFFRMLTTDMQWK